MQKLICLMLAYITLLTVLVGCSDEPEGIDDPIGEANNTISTADPKFAGRYRLYWYDLPTGTEYPAEEGALDISHNEFEYRDEGIYPLFEGNLQVSILTGKVIINHTKENLLTVDLSYIDSEGRLVMPVFHNTKERDYRVEKLPVEVQQLDENGQPIGAFEKRENEYLVPDTEGTLCLMRILPQTLGYELVGLEFLASETASQEQMALFGGTHDGGFWGVFQKQPIAPVTYHYTDPRPTVTAADYNFAVWDANGRRVVTIPLDTIATVIPELYVDAFLIYGGNGNGDINIKNVWVAKNGIFIHVGGSILYAFTENGQFVGRISVSGSLNSLVFDAEGDLVLTAMANVDGKMRYVSRYYNKSLLSFQGNTLLPEGLSAVPVFADGSDAYQVNSLGVTAFSMKNGSEVLLEWDEYDLRYQDIDEVRIADGDTIVFTVTNEETGLPRVGLLTTRDIEGMEAARVTRKKETITLAYVATNDAGKNRTIENYISLFNESNKQYKVKSVYYANDGTLSANNTLVRDILSGNIPDMILFGRDISPEAFAGLDIFRNLYDYMETDETYTKDAFLPCVLAPFENADGELPYLTMRYRLSTIAAPAENISGIDSWTLDELSTLNRSLVEDEYLTTYSSRASGNPAMWLLEQLLPCMIGDMVDYENEPAVLGDTLRELLMLCKESKLLDSDSSVPGLYANGTVRTRIETISGMRSFLTTRHCYFMGQSTVYPGYPTKGNSGAAIIPTLSLAVTESCTAPEGAWAFICFCLDEIHSDYEYITPTVENDVYTDRLILDEVNEFPCVRASAEQLIETMKHHYFRAEIKNSSLSAESMLVSVSQAYHYDIDGSYRDFHEEETNNSGLLFFTLTDEDAAALMQLLENTAIVRSSDTALMDIIYEDAQYYFNGTKSLEETVKIIENRVKIKLAE